MQTQHDMLVVNYLLELDNLCYSLCETYIGTLIQTMLVYARISRMALNFNIVVLSYRVLVIFSYAELHSF